MLSPAKDPELPRCPREAAKGSARASGLGLGGFTVESATDVCGFMGILQCGYRGSVRVFVQDSTRVLYGFRESCEGSFEGCARGFRA